MPRARALARLRRLGARALCWAPAAAVLALDAGLRRDQLREFTREATLWYGAFAVGGAVAWGLLVIASARRRGTVRWTSRALLAALALFAVGTQVETWARYRSYLNWRTTLMGNSLLPCLAAATWADRARVLTLLLAPVAFVLAVVVAVSRLAPPRRRASRAALPMGILAIAVLLVYAKPDAGWDNGTTPDVLWLNAVGALAKSMRSHEDIMVELRWLPAARTPDAVPALSAHPPRSRNVLLLLDESVRGEDVCSVPGADCDKTPFTNALLTGRLGFTQMRAVDSTTALSISVLLSGLSPTEPRDRLLSTPLLPEFAHAAGIDTAFWTSQNLLFANAGRFLDGLPLTAFASGTELEPYATYQTGADDAKLLGRVAADVPRLREPFFAVAQLSNTHFPYVVDEHDVPFSAKLDWRHMDDFGKTTVRYWDALHRQDKLIASFMEKLRAVPGGDRTVVVFLSDHGEQIGERGQVGHTWSVYDVEILVPAWVDAPPGTLSDAEAASLRSVRDAHITTLDVAPTLLDLLGVWDVPELHPWRAHMLGMSLLRGGPPADRAVVLTNCSELFSCATRNWGAMRGNLKLLATEDEKGGWRCFDVRHDPEELDDLGAAACGDLRQVAEGEGRGTPFR
jgi:glucan phosphoethanolaminetransferase (alkaline phosphatase superfamily)